MLQSSKFILLSYGLYTLLATIIPELRVQPARPVSNNLYPKSCLLNDMNNSEINSIELDTHELTRLIICIQELRRWVVVTATPTALSVVPVRPVNNTWCARLCFDCENKTMLIMRKLVDTVAVMIDSVSVNLSMADSAGVSFHVLWRD